MEVKSYSGNPTFYISRNELEVAEKLGDKYFLVLINRDKMSDASYSPMEIQNPHNFLMSENCPDWVTLKPDSYKIEINF